MHYLPFGTENLYESKERLLITQKRDIDRWWRLRNSVAWPIDLPV
jgi:hypothetical protein